MSPNVLCSGLGSYIKSFNTTLLTHLEMTEIERKLRDVKATSGLTKSDHLASLNRRHTSTDECPKCGGRMVTRTAKSSGKNVRVVSLAVGHHQMTETPEETLMAIKAFLQ